jgi:hypothetical protein
MEGRWHHFESLLRLYGLSSNKAIIVNKYS